MIKNESIKINLWEILENQNKVDEFWEMISNYLTEKTGYCINSYSLDDEIIINVNELDLDTEEK